MTSASWYRKIVWQLKGNKEFTKAGYEAASVRFVEKDLEVDCSGRHYMITGSNSGIGLATALEIARRGGVLHLVCRNATSMRIARSFIITTTGNDKIYQHQVNLSNPKEVARWAENFINSFEQLDVLINNAGCLLQERTVGDDGLETTFAVNTLAVHIITSTMLPLLQRSDDGRVIIVSSGGMFTVKLNHDDLNFEKMQPFDGRLAYSQTKRQQVVMNFCYAQRHEKIKFYSMHPGWADTPAVRNSLPEFYEAMKDVLRTPLQGADTVIWLAVSKAALKHSSGLFFQDRTPVYTHLPLAWTRHSVLDERIFMEKLEEIAKMFLTRQSSSIPIASDLLQEGMESRGAVERPLVEEGTQHLNVDKIFVDENETLKVDLATDVIAEEEEPSEIFEKYRPNKIFETVETEDDSKSRAVSRETDFSETPLSNLKIDGFVNILETSDISTIQNLETDGMDEAEVVIPNVILRLTSENLNEQDTKHKLLEDETDENQINTQGIYFISVTQHREIIRENSTDNHHPEYIREVSTGTQHESIPEDLSDSEQREHIQEGTGTQPHANIQNSMTPQLDSIQEHSSVPQQPETIREDKTDTYQPEYIFEETADIQHENIRLDSTDTQYHENIKLDSTNTQHHANILLNSSDPQQHKNIQLDLTDSLQHENIRLDSSDTQHYENIRLDSTDTQHHENIQLDSTNTQQHENIRLDSSDTQQHEKIQLDSTNTQQHKNIQLDTTNTQQHENIQLDSTDTQQHENIQLDSTNTQQQENIQLDSTDTQQHENIRMDSTDTQHHDNIREESANIQQHENSSKVKIEEGITFAELNLEEIDLSKDLQAPELKDRF